MANTVDLGTGAVLTTLTSATNLQAAELLDIQITQNRKAINVSHMSSSTYEEFLPGDLADAGSITFRVHFNPDNWADDNIITVGTTASNVVTFPEAGDTLTFTGFCTDVDISVPLEDKMVASFTYKIDGTTVTWAKGA